MVRKKKDDTLDKKEGSLPSDLFLGVDPDDLPPPRPRCTAVIPANATVAEWTAGVVHVGEAEVDLSAKLPYDIYMRAKEFAKSLKNQRSVTDVFATEKFSQVFLSEIGGSDYVCCTAKVSKGTMMTNAILDIITAKDKVPFGNAMIVQVEKMNRYVRYKPVSAKKAAEVLNGFLASKMRAVALKDPLIRKRYWNIDPGCVEGKNIFGASERDVENQYEWGPNTMLMGLHYKTHRCQRVFKHDWFKCPFYHTLLDSRRSPLHFSYSNQRCSDAPSDDKGKCPNGAKCPMAHNDCEHFYHPDFIRKSVCMYADNPSQCKGPLCSFMHPAEMMPRDFSEYRKMKENGSNSSDTGPSPSFYAPSRAPAPAAASVEPPARREFDAVPTWGEGKDEWPSALSSSRGSSQQSQTQTQGDASQSYFDSSQVSHGSQLSQLSQPNSFDPVHDSSSSVPNAGVIGGGGGVFGPPGGFGTMGGAGSLAPGQTVSAMGSGSYFGVFDSIGSNLASQFEFTGDSALGHSGLFGATGPGDDWPAEGFVGQGADDYPDTTSNILPQDASIEPQVLNLPLELSAYLGSKCTVAGTCHVCKAPATWTCSDGKCSGSLLCDHHNTMTHKRKQWRDHSPTQLEASSMTCEDCEEQLADLCFLCHDCLQVQCFECRQLDPKHRPGVPGHEVITYRLVDIQKTVAQLSEAGSQPKSAAVMPAVATAPHSQAVALPKHAKKDKTAAASAPPVVSAFADATAKAAPTAAREQSVDDVPAVSQQISMDMISSAIVRAANAPEDARINLVEARAATLEVLAKLLISILARGGPQWQTSVITHCKSFSINSVSSFDPSIASQWTWEVCSTLVERFSPIPQAGPLFRPPMVETNLLLELLSSQGKKHTKWNSHKGDACASFLVDLLRVLKLEASVLRLFDVAAAASQVEERFPQVFTRPDTDAWPPILAYIERPIGSQEGRKDILVVGGHPTRGNLGHLLQKKWDLVLDFEMDGKLLRMAEDHGPNLRKVNISSICQNVAAFRLNPEDTTWIVMHAEQEFRLDRFNYSRFAVGGAKDEALQHVFRQLAPVPFPWLETLCVVLFYGDPLKIKTLGKHVDHCLNLALRAPTLNSRFITLSSDVAGARSLVSDPVVSASVQYARDNSALFGGLAEDGVAPTPVIRVPCDGGETSSIDLSHFGCGGLLEFLPLAFDGEPPGAQLAELFRAFAHGLPVDWRLLGSCGAPATRDLFTPLLGEVKSLLETAGEMCSQHVFTLLHEPCSGGTTLARQVAWTLHSSYPVAVLARGSTSKMDVASQLCLRLYELYRKCGLPILLLVDGVDPGHARALLQEAADVPVVVFFVRRATGTEQPQLKLILSQKEKELVAAFRKASTAAEEYARTQPPEQYLMPPATNFFGLDLLAHGPQAVMELVAPFLTAGPMEGSAQSDLVLFASLLFLHKSTGLSFADASVFALHSIVVEHKASVVDWLLANPCSALLIIDVKKSTLQPLNHSVASAVVEVSRARGISPCAVLSRALNCFEPVFGQIGSKIRQLLAEMIFWRTSADPSLADRVGEHLPLLRRAHECFSSTMSAVCLARAMVSEGEDGCKAALALLSQLGKSSDPKEQASQSFAIVEVGLALLKTQTRRYLATEERLHTMVGIVQHLCSAVTLAREALSASGDPPRLEFAATLKLELLCIVELLSFFCSQQEGEFPKPLLACISHDSVLLRHGLSRCLQLYAHYQTLLTGAPEWPAPTTAYSLMWQLRDHALPHPLECFVEDRGQLELLLAEKLPGDAGCELARICAAGLLHHGLQPKSPQEWAKAHVDAVVASMRSTVEAAEYRVLDFMLWIEVARWQKKSSHSDAMPLLQSLLQSNVAGQVENVPSTAASLVLAYRLMALIEAEASGATAKRLKKLSTNVSSALSLLQRTVEEEKYPRAFYENPRQVLVSLDLTNRVSSHFFLPDSLFPYFEKKGKSLVGKLSKEANGWRVLYHGVPLCVDSRDEHVEAASFQDAEVTFRVAATGRSLHAFDVDLCESALRSTQAKHRKGCLDGRPQARTCRCSF